MDLDLLEKLVNAKDCMTSVKMELADIDSDRKELDKRRGELLVVLKELEETLNQYEIKERS